MQEILEDSTQSLALVPRILAQASSATVRVRTPSTPLPDSADAATVDPISVVTTVAASAGDETITVGSAAWVAGVPYLIEQTDGLPLSVTASKTSTGTTLYLDQPLPCAVAVGSAVKGMRITHALTSAETSDVGECLAVWAVTIGGVVYTWRESFLIVSARSEYALTGDMLKTLSPLIYADRPGVDETFSETISAAWTLYLAPALKAKGVRLERVISASELIPPHVAAIDLHLATIKRRDPQAIEMARVRFSEALALALEGNDTWVDGDAGVDSGHDNEAPAGIGTMAWVL